MRRIRQVVGRKPVVWVFWLCCGCWLQAQTDEFSKRSINTLDGLSHNNVWAIFEDSRGFIWTGTTDGLNRYDGYSFQTYQLQTRTSGSLPSNNIFSISEDRNQVLWIGTRHHEVCFFDLKTDRFVPAAKLPTEYQLPPGFHFSEAVHLPNGEHWICGNGDVLVTSAQGVRSLKAEKILPPDLPVNQSRIAAGAGGIVWIATTEHVINLRHDERPLRAKVIPGVYNSMNDIFPYAENLICATGRGIHLATPGGDRLIKVNEINARALLVDRGKLWVGTHRGLWTQLVDAVVTERGKTPAASWGQSVPDFAYSVNTIYRDRCGNIWTGTNTRGLVKLKPTHGNFRTYSLGDPAFARNRIRAIFEDCYRNVWVGTSGKGMFRLVESAGGERVLTPLDSALDIPELINTFYAFELFGKYYLYVGTHYPSRPQVLEIRGDKVRVATAPAIKKLLSVRGSIMDLQQDADWLWIASYERGLYRYAKRTGELTQFWLSSDPRRRAITKNRGLLIDREDNLWISTNQGLYRLPAAQKAYPPTDLTRYYHDPLDSTSLSYNYALPLFESRAGDLWIGTMGGGLNRWVDSTRSFQHWTVTDGLPNNTIKGILEDDEGNLWISSNRGLSRFSPAEETFVNYDLSDGLQDYEFTDLACLRRANGELLFGGVGGLNAFFPKEIRPDTTVTSPILTDLYVLNTCIRPRQNYRDRMPLTQHLNDTEVLVLRYDENTFSLHFAGLNYRSPRKIRYRYRLEGVDKTWVYTDGQTRFARYTKLPPGRYVFRLMASNTDGLWNGPVKSLTIVIPTPWWKSKLAYAAYLLVLLTVTATIFFRRYALIRIQRKQELVRQAFEWEKVRKNGYRIEVKKVNVTPADVQFMEQLREVVEAHIADVDFSVGQFSATFHLSQTSFNRKLKALTGHTALGFLREYRIKRAAQLLAQSDLPVKEIFYRVGIANMKLFRTYFKRAYGVPPSTYRKQQAGKEA